MPEILLQFNWLDIFFVILLLGMVYKGLKNGVGSQMLSLAGAVFLVFLSIGYYNYFSVSIFGFLAQEWSKPVSFFVISAIVYFAIKLFERIFNVINNEEVSTIERIGGVVIASLRGFIFFGLIGIFFILVPIETLQRSAIQESQTCMYFVKMDAQIYSWITKIFGKSAERERDDVLNEVLGSVKEGDKRNET